jgi:kynurenine formamidase
VLDEEVPVFPGRYFKQTLVTTAHHAHPGGGVGENDVNWITELVSGTMPLGTHLDALSHLQMGERGYGGISVSELAGTAGVTRLGIETVPQTVTRGWLVDVAGLEAGAVITPHDCDGIHPEPGDAVLLHTGWGRHWNDPDTYLSGEPGPGCELAEWHAVYAIATGVAYTLLSSGNQQHAA